MCSLYNETLVTIVDANSYEYPRKDSLFRPGFYYPELKKLSLTVSKKPNNIYHAVREALKNLGFDKEDFGKESWNPLGEIIKPGDTVLIKPNLVMDQNANPGGGTDCLYTQPSVVAPIIDYTLLALNNTGKIIIGDAPMQECVFSNIMENGYSEMIEFYKAMGVDIEMVDFRELSSRVIDGIHINSINENSRGTVVDLARESEFAASSNAEMRKMRVTNYDPRIMPLHHNNDTHEYYISDYVLSADVIINMPKPKTHRKAGVTIALKNLVGINVRKEFLPHHTVGSVHDGGDEYEKRSLLHRARTKLIDIFNIVSAEKRMMVAKFLRLTIRTLDVCLDIEKTPYSEGSWWGNRTITRTIADLNKIIFYADKDGIIKHKKQRRMIIIGDMIVSGDGEGPVSPTPKPCGYIVAGVNPVYFDEAVSTLMGFDAKKIPTLCAAKYTKSKLLIADPNKSAKINFNGINYDSAHFPAEKRMKFEATQGWKGHIEY